MAKKRKPVRRKAKKPDSDHKRETEKLEMEKSALQEKNKHLIQIIDEISKSRPEPEEEKPEVKEKKPEEDGKEKKSLLNLKEFGGKIKEKLEDNKDKEKFRKDVSEMVKKSVDSKISKLSDDLKKVSGIESKINSLAEKITAPSPIQAPQLVPPEAYVAGNPHVGSISKGLAAFGEEIDLETEFLEIKKTMSNLNKNLENLRKKSEYSIMNIQDKIKILEKIPEMEETFQSINEKLGPDNVQKLRKLIFSADEIVDEIIPELVDKKLRTKIAPAINEINNLKDGIKSIRAAMNHVRVDILNLQKIKEDVRALESEKNKLYKEIIGRDAKFREGIDILKDNVKKRIDSLSVGMSEKMDEGRRSNHEKIEKDIHKVFSDVVKLKISEMDKIQADIGDRIRKLDLSDEEIRKSIRELKAPENVKKWVAIQLKEIKEGTIPEIKKLKKDALSQSDAVKTVNDEIKNLNAFSSHISRSDQTQNQIIEKLSADKENLTNMTDGLKSELRVLDERLLLEKERISALETDLKVKGTELDVNLNIQKNTLTDFRLELGKMIADSAKVLKNELETERKEDLDNHAAEMREELSKIQVVRTELEEYKKKHEARLDKIVTDMKDIPPSIRMLKERIDGLDAMGKTLDKGKISEPEFSSITKMITKRIGEIEDHFDGIEDRISKNRSQIEKTVNQLLSDDKILKSTQGSIGKALEGKIGSLTEGLSSKTEDLSLKLNDNNKTISELIEKTQVLDSLTKNLPGKVGNHENLINKIMESKEFLVKRSEAMTTELKSLTDNLSSEAERISVVEQDVKNQSKGHEKRLDELSQNLSSVKSLIPQVNTLKESMKNLGKDTREINKRLSVLKPPENIKNWFNEKIVELDGRFSTSMSKIAKELDDNNETLLGLRKNVTELDSVVKHSKEQDKDISGLLHKIGTLDSITRNLPKKLDTYESMLNKVVDSREILAKRTGAMASEIKSLSENLSSEKSRLMALEQRMGLEDKSKESRLDEISKGLVRVEDRLSDIDSIKSKIDDLESVGKTLGEKSVTESEFISTIKSVSKRVDDIEDSYKKLDKEFSMDKNRLQTAISQVMSDDKILKSTQSSLDKWLREELHGLRAKLSSESDHLSRQLQEKSETVNKKLYSDVERLTNQIAEHTGMITGMKEKMNDIETLEKQSEDMEDRISKLKEMVHVINSITKELPKKFDIHSRELSDLLGSSGFLAKKLESLDRELGNTNEKIGSEGDRLTELEKEFKSISRARETRLDNVDKTLSDVNNKTQNASLEIRVLKEKLEDIEKRFDHSVKQSMEEKRFLREDVRKQGERVGRILRELKE